MAIVKAVDLEVTHGLLVFHTKEVRKQLVSPNPDWDLVIRSLRKIESESASSIELAKKIKGDH